jgi:hypothetical protein
VNLPVQPRALCRLLLCAALLACAQAQAQSAHSAFDHSHAAWSGLLAKHVAVLDGGHASRVRYADMAKDGAALKAYLASLSQVGEAEFQAWSRAQRLAFLLNAYNAHAVEKVLSRYPDLRSIWDFGRIFGNPFKDRFFSLLGRPTSLDDIENGMLRKPGAYDDVRVHAALNCASVGCPMLRAEAYVADRLDAQLEDQMRRFLSDRGRNRYAAPSGRLEVSKIFDWFKEDWARGTRNFDDRLPPVRSRESYLARYADLLADEPAGRTRVAAGQAPLDFLEYDWTLNDASAGR